MDEFYILTFSIICRFVKHDQITTTREKYGSRPCRKAILWIDPMLYSSLIGLYSWSYNSRGSGLAIQDGQFANEWSWISFLKPFCISTIWFEMKWQPQSVHRVPTSTSKGVHTVQCLMQHEIWGWLVSTVQCLPFPPTSLQSPSRFHSIPPWMSWSTSDLISYPPTPTLAM